MSELTLSIFSPERKLVDSMRVNKVTLTGSEGQIQILPGHSDMLGTLETGTFAYQPAQGEEVVGFGSGGFFQVADGVVELALEVLELSGEIDLERAKSSQQKAQSSLTDGSLGPEDLEKAQQKLQRAVVRQQIASKFHS